MLLKVADHIQNCLDHAAEARRRADAATDPYYKNELLDLETGWLGLAENFRFVLQMERFLTDAENRRTEKP